MGGVSGRAGRQHGAGAVVRANRVRGGGEATHRAGYQGEENRGGNARAERVGEDAVSAVQSGAAAGGLQVLLLRREGHGVRVVGKIVLRRDEDEHVCYISLVGRKANGYRCLCREEPVGCRQKEISDDSATGTVYHPTGRFLLKIADL